MKIPAAILLVLTIACTTPLPEEPTPNIDATVEAEVDARLAIAPTATPYPTATPRPTHALALPHVLVVTPTPRPSSLTPVASEWENTGDWYRDHEYESGLKMVMEVLGSDAPISVATLDASAWATFQDLSLSLGCIGPTKVAYLTPYATIPDDSDTYAFGLLDTATGEWEPGQVLWVSNPSFTDDGGAVYISSQAQIREIVAIIRQKVENRSPGLVISGAIFVEGVEDDESMVSGDFVPAGYEDALAYLPCFAEPGFARQYRDAGAALDKQRDVTVTWADGSNWRDGISHHPPELPLGPEAHILSNMTCTQWEALNMAVFPPRGGLQRTQLARTP